MTNEKRVELVIAPMLGSNLSPREIAKGLCELGLITPDPPQRYRAVDRFVWGEDPEAPVLEFLAATADERAAVLAALNALPEEGEKP